MFQLPIIDDHKQFEKLIRDICRYVFKEPTFELYGKRGEGQDGIDGWHIIDSSTVAFQCKKKTSLHTERINYLISLSLK